MLNDIQLGEALRDLAEHQFIILDVSEDAFQVAKAAPVPTETDEIMGRVVVKEIVEAARTC